jgi:mevalonate kinase
MSGPIATGYAGGKIILFGEHAVVHEQPAIAVPLTSIRAEAEVFPGNGDFSIVLPEIEREFRFLTPEEGSENGLVVTARLVLEKLNQPVPDLTVSLRSTIPQKSGFGSGAAVSAAIGRALSAALGSPLSDDELNRIVYEVEKMHHGTPSGIDNTVICYEKPIYFVRGRPIEFMKIVRPIHLLVANLPHSTPTKVTVSDVRFLYEKHPRRVGRIFNRIGNITREARQAIETGDVDALGPMMNENHRLLKRLTVSDEVMDRLCRLALRAGARGAKLSGGGRGGNIIVLIDKPARGLITDALLQNGASQVFYAVLGSG